MTKTLERTAAPPILDDDTLMMRVAAGDSAALTALYDRHGRAVGEHGRHLQDRLDPQLAPSLDEHVLLAARDVEEPVLDPPEVEEHAPPRQHRLTRPDVRRRRRLVGAWRARTAKEHGVPAYVVFHDGTLRAIASRSGLG